MCMGLQVYILYMHIEAKGQPLGFTLLTLFCCCLFFSDRVSIRLTSIKVHRTSAQDKQRRHTEDSGHKLIHRGTNTSPSTLDMCFMGREY